MADPDLNKYSKASLVMVFSKLLGHGFPLNTKLILETLDRADRLIRLDSADRAKRHAEAVRRAVDKHPRATARHKEVALQKLERAERRYQKMAEKVANHG